MTRACHFLFESGQAAAVEEAGCALRVVIPHLQSGRSLRFAAYAALASAAKSPCLPCSPIALGQSRAEIASRLGVSEDTAISHCRNIYAKLNVRNRSELIAKVFSK